MGVDTIIHERDGMTEVITTWDEIKALDAVFWEEELQILLRLLFPLVYKAVLAGAEDALGGLISIGIGVDWALVNQAALAWAREYSYGLVSGITKTTQRFVQTAVSEWVESGEPLEALVEMIEPLFGKVRSEMVATTEVTRAFAEGNLITWRESGVVQGKMWMTAQDDLVCPICGPLAGMTVPLDSNGFTTELGGLGLKAPPAHVNCRCWLQPQVAITT